VNTYISNFSIGLLGFVAGIAFLISCGSDDAVSNSGAAESSNTVILKDADGLYVGRVIGMFNYSNTYVLTDQGYRAIMDIHSGHVQYRGGLEFESGDCTGPAFVEGYFLGPNPNGSVFTAYSDVVVAYNAGLIVYSPHDAQANTVTINSKLTTGLTCDTLNIPYTTERFPVFANDPSITGIQNTAYSNHMRME